MGFWTKCIASLFFFIACRSAVSIQLNRLVEAALANLDSSYGRTVRLNLPEDRIPEKIVFGNADYGYFATREFSFETKAVDVLMAPPGYKKPIEFYALYPGGRRVDLGLRRFTNPTPDYVQQAFRMERTGEWRAPFLVVSSKLVNQVHGVNLVQAQIAQVKENPRILRGPPRVDGAVVVVLNRLGEVVWGRLPTLLNLKKSMVEDAALEDKEVKIGVEVLGAGRFAFALSGPNFEVQHQDVPRVGLRNHSLVPPPLTSFSPSFVWLGSGQALVAGLTDIPEPGPLKSDAAGRPAVFFWNSGKLKPVWKGQTILRSSGQGNPIGSVAPLGKDRVGWFFPRQQKLLELTTDPIGVGRQFDLRPFHPKDVGGGKGQPDSLLLVREDAQGMFVSRLRLLGDGRLTPSQTFRPKVRVHGSSGGVVGREKSVIALFRMYTRRNHLVQFDELGKETARLSWKPALAGLGRLWGTLDSTGNEQFLGNKW